MRLVISHFFNEEYLLPWWLKHHREIFDHGILIDYHSTDRSVEICRELCPNWEVVTSANESFAALKCDFEVMQHEARFPEAWKIALNTTEFLIGGKLDNVIARAEADNNLGVFIPGAHMVDNMSETPPDAARPLVEQKFHGFWESEFPIEKVHFPWLHMPVRARLLHRHDFGAYSPGRHGSMLPMVGKVPNTELGIWWYGYSPWTPEFVSRKTQIKSKMDPLDKRVGFGSHHIATEQDQEMRRAALIDYCRDLSVSSFSPTEHDHSLVPLIDQRNSAVAQRDAALGERDEAIRVCREELRAKRHAQRYPWKYVGSAWRMRSSKK